MQSLVFEQFTKLEKLGKIPVDEYKAFARDFNPVKYDPEAIHVEPSPYLIQGLVS
ncbi:hypothetical protein ES708_27987 [subsurface metagenome]